MAEQQLSIGCRIHGNIAAVLAGTPALVFTIDTRTEELCRYHNIPFIPAERIDENTRLRDLYERADFASVLDGHARRFAHFVDFLNANGLRHIYREDPERSDAPLDAAVAALKPWGKIEATPFISPVRYFKGAAMYWPKVKKKLRKKLKKKLKL